MKVAVNKCFGGFSVSKAVFKELGFEWDGYGYLDNNSFGIESSNYFEWRKHPSLIQAIKKIGEDKASGEMAKVRVVDIPDGVEWEIDDYGGIETVHEVHRIW